jgi:hypothetical protein
MPALQEDSNCLPHLSTATIARQSCTAFRNMNAMGSWHFWELPCNKSLVEGSTLEMLRVVAAQWLKSLVAHNFPAGVLHMHN